MIARTLVPFRACASSMKSYAPRKLVANQLLMERTSFASMAEDGGRVVSLKDLRDRFGLSEGTKPTKKRDFVVRMATFGLWRVKIDRETRYSISLGAVAEIFHNEVFTPIRKEFESKLRGVS